MDIYIIPYLRLKMIIIKPYLRYFVQLCVYFCKAILFLSSFIALLTVAIFGSL